jgi:hypothetical protein
VFEILVKTPWSVAMVNIRTRCDITVFISVRIVYSATIVNKLIFHAIKCDYVDVQSTATNSQELQHWILALQLNTPGQKALTASMCN